MSQRSYQRNTPELKEQVLGLLSLGKPVTDMTRELQISTGLFYAWRSRNQSTQGEQSEPTAEKTLEEIQEEETK